MNFQDCVKFAAENPVCFFATSDGRQPHVRTLLLWFADERGFHFMILSPKAVSKQLKENPLVEVCFFHNSTSPAEWVMMRVTGRIEFVPDPEMKKKAADERHFLEDIIGRPLEPITEVFRVKSGECVVWKLQDNLKEAALPRIKF